MRDDALLQQWQQRLQHAAGQPLPANIPQLFSQAAASQPDRVLMDLFEDGQRLTYAEFDALSNQLATSLQAAGVQAGMHVAVMLPNGLQWHLTWLAVLKLGAAVVPVNPSYTVREVEYVLTDAQVSAWVLGTERVELLKQITDWPASLARQRIWVTANRLGEDSSWQRLLNASPAGSHPAPAVPQPGLDTLANIQYTSGTTGFPKGCLLTHGYWLNLAQAACLMHPEPAPGQVQMQRFFTAQPFFYMDPFWQLLMTAMCCGTLVAARKISATRFLGWLADHQIDWAQLPELALKSIDSVQGRTLALREVFTFGWSAESRQTFVQRFQVPAVESFGMTEIGLGLVMPNNYPTAAKPTSVGLAGLRRQARIVDDAGQPVGPGVTGELQIRGDHLFKGYFNKPLANAEVFDGDWFRTGDAFVQDKDGFYRIVGRFKDMIRRSNENIAAREVEAVVRELGAVLDCAAVPVPDPVRKEEVKIMVQVRPELLTDGKTPREVLPVDQLLTHCQGALAPFKVPRYVQFVTDFPRTSSNKIIKHQLINTSGSPLSPSFDRIQGVWHT